MDTKQLSAEVLTSVGIVHNRNREAMNDRVGLSTVTESGNSCITVGVHEKLPDMFFKVVLADDPAVKFAEAIMHGELFGTIFPEIMDVTVLGNYAVIIMERLESIEEDLPIEDRNYTLQEALGHYDMMDSCEALRDMGLHDEADDIELLRNWINERNYTYDMHGGNFGYRADGSICVFDPVMTHRHHNAICRLPKSPNAKAEAWQVLHPYRIRDAKL